MTNFAPFIDSANTRAWLAQRGKAEQKRFDLRLVGLGMVVTRDGGIPLASCVYPGKQDRRHPVRGHPSTSCPAATALLAASPAR